MMILFGASGHCKVIIDILKSRNITIDLILDDYPKTESMLNIPVKKNELSLSDNTSCIISIGDNWVRKMISEKYNNLNYQVACHSKSNISIDVKLGNGTVVMQGANINPSSQIGKHCIINTGAVVEHDCLLDNFVHISPNASLAGNVSVGEGTQIGIGASVIQGIRIGKWVKVGAGAVVINDIPDFSTVVGVPGKIIKNK